MATYVNLFQLNICFKHFKTTIDPLLNHFSTRLKLKKSRIFKIKNFPKRSFLNKSIEKINNIFLQ